jgi:hypothetical protein
MKLDTKKKVRMSSRNPKHGRLNGTAQHMFVAVVLLLAKLCWTLTFGKLHMKTAGSHAHTLDVHAVSQKKSKSGSWGISPTVKPLINQQLQLGPATLILRQMRNANMTHIPGYAQLSNYSIVARKKHFSELPQDDMGTFLSWLHNNSYKDSLADDELFVLPNALVPETVDPMNPDIKIVAVLSTRALLRNRIRQQHTSMPSFLSCDGI